MSAIKNGHVAIAAEMAARIDAVAQHHRGAVQAALTPSGAAFSEISGGISSDGDGPLRASEHGTGLLGEIWREIETELVSWQNGVIMRQKAQPWLALGMSRATWYRHGKPTEPRPKYKNAAERAAQFGQSLRSHQRLMRILSSPLGVFYGIGLLWLTHAEMLLRNPEAMREFLDFVRRLMPAFAQAS